MKTVSIYTNIIGGEPRPGCTILIHVDGVAVGYTQTLTATDAYATVARKLQTWDQARGYTKIPGSAEFARTCDRMYTRHNHQPIYTAELG